MSHTLIIRIPAQTVKVDLDKWKTEFDLDARDVREDVKSYFEGRCQEIIDGLGLGPE